MRQIIILSSVLCISLAASYFTWTKKSPTLDENAPQVPMFVGDAVNFRWEGKQTSVEISKKSDALGAYTWVTITEPSSKQAAAGQDTGAEAAEAKITQFKGNDAAEKLWSLLSPWHAIRKLPSVDKTVYQFDDPLATLTVERSAGPIALVVGGDAYGGKSRYVELNGEVFLVSGDDVKQFQFAKSRLMERRLFPIDLKTVSDVEVQGTDAKLAWKRGRDAEGDDIWSRDEQVDSLGGNWVERLIALRAQSYVDEAALPATESILTFTVRHLGENWSIELLKQANDPSPDYYTKSTFSRGITKLNRSTAAKVVDEWEKVKVSKPQASVEPPNEATPVPPPATPVPPPAEK